MQPKTLTALLQQGAHLQEKGITFITGSNQEAYLSYATLFQSALKVLGALQDAGVQPGDEMIFQLDDDKTFVIAFWGCVLGGIIPVPLSVGYNDGHARKLFNVWQTLQRPRLMSTGTASEGIAAYAAKSGLEVVWEAMAACRLDAADILSFERQGVVQAAAEDQVAFIQFSSGSTGQPKGVVLTHRNLITNISAISQAAGYTAQDAMLSWMPLTHDMGLIGFHINPLFAGASQILIPTQVFIRRPALWMEKATAHRVTILCSPNFGYDYLLRHCERYEQRHQWDLSAVRLIYNGAEPVSPLVCQRFNDYLSGYGLSRSAMRPVYGLAEASLAVTVPRQPQGVKTVTVKRDQVKPGDQVLEVLPGEDSISFVNVGQAINDCQVRIAGEDNVTLEDRMIGAVQIKGPNVTTAYYNDPAATAQAATPDGWWKTGDLGFMIGADLFITGRQKDIIFHNGQNYYPYDLENVIAQLPGMALNKVVVTGRFQPETGKDEILVFLLHRGNHETFEPIARKVYLHLNEKTGLEADGIVATKDIPRTTSGKLQRFKLLEQYNAGVFSDATVQVKQAAVQSIPGDKGHHVTLDRLRDIMKELLLLDTVDMEDDFFQSGGNSLKAAALSIRVLQDFDVELPLEQIFRGRTLRGIWEAIEGGTSASYTALPVAADAAYYPLSSAQQNIYYSWAIDKDSIAYNLPVVVSIQGDPDTVTLATCLQEMVRRHATLRSSFHMLTQPVCRISPEVNLHMPVLECSAEQVDSVLLGQLKPFNLEQAPLLHVALIKVIEAPRYLFLLDFSHIISDGVSVSLFMNELFRLYAGEQLPDPSVQYKDFACWESEFLQTAAVRRQQVYWEQLLKDEWPSLQLPLDYQRPATLTTTGKKWPFRLDSAITAKLRLLALSCNCSLHALTLALYQLLLAAYTGQDELLTGIPVAGRRHGDLQRMQGMFVNNLVINCTIDRNETFVQLLQRVQDTVIRALDHQEYPAELLAGLRGGRRDVSRHLLFDTMFLYQDMELPSAAGTGLQVGRYFLDPGISKFDISMEIFEEQDTLAVAIEYATALFREETIVRMAATYQHLATIISAYATHALSTVPLITAAEREWVIHGYNDTAVDYPREKTLHGLFEEQARQYSGQVAIQCNGQSLTYEALNDRAGKLAAVLWQKGLQPGDIVAVFMESSLELIVALLGILKAGGCFLPVETDLPQERARFLLTDSRCRYLVTNSQLLQHPVCHDLPDVNLVSTSEIAALGEVSDSEVTPQQLAYVIYTSGTTGYPKGVMIRHQSIVNYLIWAQRKYAGGGRADMPLYTSISSDLTLTSIFLPLISRGTLFIYPYSSTALQIEEVMKDNQVAILKATPSHLRILAADRWLPPTGGSRVKTLIVGGEQLETRLAAAIAHKLGADIMICNEYGPTEATVGCMIHCYEPEASQAVVPVGIPIANSRIYVLNSYLQPVPIGVPGELYIAGEGLADGYLFRQELTTERFVPDPFHTGDRMYKTGDMARHLPEGIIVYMGRYDQQVKINGYRVELQEINEQLKTYKGITDVLALVRESSAGHPTLCAYYTSDLPPGEQLPPAFLRDFLASRVPYYMIPSRYVRLDSFPLAVSGKVDYDAFPAVDQLPAEIVTERTRSQGFLADLMVKIWQEVLQTEGVSTTSNFLELGGDSIKAVQVAFRLSEKGIYIKAKEILIYQTIEQLLAQGELAETVTLYEQGIVEGQVSLSPVKHWFFSYEPAYPGFYNQSVLLKLHLPIAIDLLQESFRLLIAHHDGLRVNYDTASGALYFNDDHLKNAFDIQQLQIGDSLSDVSFYDLKNGFNITEDLLIKAFLLTKDDGQVWLLVTAHHLVMDAVSWRILLEDFRHIYQSLAAGTEVSLPRKTASVADWQAALEDYAVTITREEERYWKQSEEVDFHLPLDNNTDDWTVQHLRTVHAMLEKEPTAFLIKEAHQTYNTDVPILLNLAVTLALKEWTGAERVVIEQEYHGRVLDVVDTSRTVNWFTILYPLVITLADDLPGNQIQAMKEQVRKVPHNGIGYGLLKYMQGRVSAAKPADTQVRLNYLGQFGAEMNNDLFSYEMMDHGPDTDMRNVASARLELNVMVMNECLHLSATYNHIAHADATIQLFIDRVHTHLLLILDHIRNEKTVHFTPSDFEGLSLDQDELNTLFV